VAPAGGAGLFAQAETRRAPSAPTSHHCPLYHLHSWLASGGQDRGHRVAQPLGVSQRCLQFRGSVAVPNTAKTGERPARVQQASSILVFLLVLSSSGRLAAIAADSGAGSDSGGAAGRSAADGGAALLAGLISDAWSGGAAGGYGAAPRDGPGRRQSTPPPLHGCRHALRTRAHAHQQQPLGPLPPPQARLQRPGRTPGPRFCRQRQRK